MASPPSAIILLVPSLGQIAVDTRLRPEDTPAMNDLHNYCLEIAARAKKAAADLAVVTGAQKQEWLRASSKRLVASTAALLEANGRDLAAAGDFGLTDAAVDRLRLTPARIQAMAVALDEIAALPEPVGEIISSSIRPNGLEVQKVRVPLGVVFFIYESRPNVTSDAAAICVKSGNAVILRGGKEAAHSNRAIAELLSDGCRRGWAAGRRRTTGGHRRSRCSGRTAPHARVDQRGHSSRRRKPHPPRERRGRMPVIKHFTGNCHVYLDRTADADMAERLTVNSKCQRLGVCNAAESLLVHAAAAERSCRGLARPSSTRVSKSAVMPARLNSCPPPDRPASRTILPSILGP